MGLAVPDCKSLSDSDLERRLSLCVDFSRRRLRGFDVGHGCPSIFFAATLGGVLVHLRVSFDAESFLMPGGIHRVAGTCALLVLDPLALLETSWCSVEQPFDFQVAPIASAAVAAPSARGLYLQAVDLALLALDSVGPYQARLESLQLGHITPAACPEPSRRL